MLIAQSLKIPIELLDNKSEEVRIYCFDEFYRLACLNNELRETIYNILCAFLREKTTNKKYLQKIKFIAEEKKSEIRPTKEVRRLLDVLFQRRDSQGKLVFAGFKFNLQGVNLQGADLRGVHLRRADFRRANLRKANLQRADLREANFDRTDLPKANLSGAHLQRADLRRANLQLANLQGANLQDANLWEADLRDADLRRADLRGTDLRNADLQGGKNLDRALLREAKIEGAVFPEIGVHKNGRDER